VTETENCNFPDARLAKRFGSLLERISHGVGDSIPSATDTIQTSNPTINGAPGVDWVGATTTDKTPFGYKGGGTLNYAVEVTGGQGGLKVISNADLLHALKNPPTSTPPKLSRATTYFPAPTHLLQSR